MATTNNYTLGIVLNEMEFGESSKIIRVFTRNYGKISIMVKGAMTPRSKNLSVSQVFGLNEYLLKKGQNFYYIGDAKIVESNFKIRESYDSLIYASLLLEVLEKSSLGGEANKKVFDLMRKTLSFFNLSKDPISLALAFELKYLSFIGYRPKLETKEKAYFSIREGIIEFQDPYSFSLSRRDLLYLNKILYGKLEELENIEEIKELDVNRKKYLHNIILKYIKYNLDISSFKSDKLFN
ncbi:DNA repair protein RecO [Peptoniphilus grossensis]|uniref:DNA repair protein RecO n=1 Tax=Peptoniphilus grossensis TaxID=1465756 RepID=UPI003995B92E